MTTSVASVELLTPAAPGRSVLLMAELEISGGRIETVHPIDDDIRQRAALQVCAHASDADEAREFLQALGLMPRE